VASCTWLCTFHGTSRRGVGGEERIAGEGELCPFAPKCMHRHGKKGAHGLSFRHLVGSVVRVWRRRRR